MPLYSATYADPATALREASIALSAQWGVAPRCVLSCAGGSDEHWQLWHPARCRRGDHPAYVLIGADLTMHPDAPMLVRR